MPIFKWIRDLFGIRKDLIEVKKTKLEIKKLKDEQREPDVIEKADFEDIKKYDPKTQELEEKIVAKEKVKLQFMIPRKARSKRRLLLPILMVIFLILLFLFLKLKVFP